MADHSMDTRAKKLGAKRIILLVGPKGAGKTTLAARMEREFGFAFVRVEAIWMELAKEVEPTAPQFDVEGQLRVMDAVRQCLWAQSTVVLESTGTAPWFGHQLEQLGALAPLFLVQVKAPLSVCAGRVRQRDTSFHIDVSDDRIAEINAIAAQVDLDWDLAVFNDGRKEIGEIAAGVKRAAVGE